MRYKTVVIGSGPAGYTSAIRIAQLGGKVALVERDLIGGICTNWGCTPSKAMITSAKYARYVRESSKYGIYNDNVRVDFQKVAEKRDEVMEKSRHEIRRLLDHWGIDIIQGNGEVIDPNHVKVTPYQNPNALLTNARGESPYTNEYKTIEGEMTLETDSIILATGSEPSIPGGLVKDDPSIISSNKLIWIKELPQELTIVGGGIIGLEFSAMFNQLGTKVRIVELLDRCLANMDNEISSEIMRELQNDGIEILTGHKVIDITQGKMRVEIVATGEIKEIDSPVNLIAIGRKAVINSPQLTNLGIEFTEKGVAVNNRLETNIPGIYAIGDATGQSILAHVAIQQGIVCAENIMGISREITYDIVPAIVYTMPEVASVGTVPEDMQGVKIVKFPFSANLRASIEGHNTGFVKLWIKEESNILLAVQIIGDYSAEVIQGYANIMSVGVDLDAVSKTIHAHPTYNEIIRNSLEYAMGRAIEYT